MIIALAIGLPVIIIVSVVLFLKLSFLKSFLTIVLLAICSTMVVNFVYCSILQTQCESDALNAAGYFFHALCVVVISSVIYGFLRRWFKKNLRMQDS